MTHREELVVATDLQVHFAGRRSLLSAAPPPVRAVDGVSLGVARGEVVALVGESGCGKSTTGRAVLQLVRPTAGSVRLAGRELTTLDAAELRRARRHMQMIFQDPFASLNPRMTAGETVEEPLMVHGIDDRAERRARVAESLEQVGLRADWVGRLPHEFSGGQRQRLAIARAIAVRPDFIVADEPLSALDVSLQIQVVMLLAELRERFDLTYLLISHDLALVSRIADRVAVMYLGKIVETAPARDIFERPAHPYTRALLDAVPIPDPRTEGERIYQPLRGEIPSPSRPPSGCRFRTRCPHAMARCAEVDPLLRDVAPGHTAACHLHDATMSTTAIAATGSPISSADAALVETTRQNRGGSQ